MDNLYVFHGADSKAGVTMIAQSVAEYIAEALPDEDVLLVMQNGHENSLYLEDCISPIDTYRTRIDSGISIYKSDIEHSKRIPNLYIISGVRKEIEERLYMPETAEKLLTGLSDRFGLIIADTGSSPDNGLALGTLLLARDVYMVFTQSEAAMRRYENMRCCYEKLNIDFAGYVVNKYRRDNPYGIEYIRDRLSLGNKKILSVRMSSLSMEAEIECRTLFGLRDDQYIKDIEKIALAITESAGMKMREAGGKHHGKVLFR